MMSDKQSTRAAVLIVILLFATIPCAIAGWVYWDYLGISGLQRHGQRQEAIVLNIQQVMHHQTHAQAYCEVIVNYKFTPKRWTSPLTRSSSLGDCGQGNWQVDYVTKNHTMPVAYDMLDPSISRANFADSVFRQDTTATAKARLWALGKIVLFVAFVLGFCAWNSRKKDPTSPLAV